MVQKMMSWIRVIKLGLAATLMALLGACGDAPQSSVSKNISVQRNSFAPVASPRILMMGDSLLAWNGAINASIGDSLAQNLGEPVMNKSRVGATVLSAIGIGIETQYEQGDWDWVVLNGGGNDLMLGCGCMLCANKIERLISADGTSGQIPATIAKLRQRELNIVYVGYLRTPGMVSPIEHCHGIGNKLERRIEALAARTPGFTFISLKSMVPSRDRSFHAADMIHPSIKGSEAIGRRIASHIRATEGYKITNAY